MGSAPSQTAARSSGDRPRDVMTNYFKWGQPELLVWLWLAPVIALLAWRGIRLRLAAARRFVPLEGDRRLALRPLLERLIYFQAFHATFKRRR